MQLPYKAIEGKTYTLFDKSDSTYGFYEKIGELANQVLDKCDDKKSLIRIIQSYSGKKRLLVRVSSREEDESLISFMLHLLNNSLSGYTEKTDEHLKGLPVLKSWDRSLATSRIQYHLYMLEFELTNRLYLDEFRKTDKKIALLPHCLRDFQVECKSVPAGDDYRCRHCSKNCYQNYVSRLLESNNITPYIWKGGNIKGKSKLMSKHDSSLGILGIACLPELVRGMRKCQEYNIPAIGIPLDANRCIRWMGSFYPNSVNLEMLEKLITK